jgi:hypothetical protein
MYARYKLKIDYLYDASYLITTKICESSAISEMRNC